MMRLVRWFVLVRWLSDGIRDLNRRRRPNDGGCDSPSRRALSYAVSARLLRHTDDTRDERLHVVVVVVSHPSDVTRLGRRRHGTAARSDSGGGCGGGDAQWKWRRRSDGGHSLSLPPTRMMTEKSGVDDAVSDPGADAEC
jgi:hypothetical protein